jgi:hypothetical protein
MPFQISPLFFMRLPLLAIDTDRLNSSRLAGASCKSWEIKNTVGCIQSLLRRFARRERRARGESQIDNLADMPKFIKLPSGLLLNLRLVSRVVPTVEHGTTSLTVHFSGGDIAVLTSDDATALRKRFGSNTALSSNIKTLIFWLVIVSAMLLVYAVVRR